MKNFLTYEALVRAYWQRLTSSIVAAHKSGSRLSGRRAPEALRTRQRRASRPPSRRYGVAGSTAATARARSDSVFIK